MLTVTTPLGFDPQTLGKALAALERPGHERRLRFGEALAALRAEAAAAGITPRDVEEELDAWKRERAARGRVG